MSGESRGASLLVRGARSYPPGPSAATVDVRVVEGVIDAVGADLERGGLPELDAAGRTVIPGLIDVHVHFRDPGLEHVEGWDRGSAGALHGGVTSVVEVQNNPPLSTSRAALVERIEHVRRRSRVDFGCLANLLEASLPELDAMAPLTPGFKCFLGGSTGLGGVLDDALLERLFAGAARAGRMVVAHCEDEALLQRDKARWVDGHPQATVAVHHLARSSEAEAESVRKAIHWVRTTGAELHVFHVSSAAAVDHVRRARREGLRVWASTAPHFLLLSSEWAERLGNLLKVNPSIKTPADSLALAAALATGDVDAIGTDHAPHPLEYKQRAYAKAPSGMPSVDLLWPLVFELVRRGWLDGSAALASVTSRAAASMNLPRKGRLARGFDGDLVLFDPTRTFRVEGAKLPSRSKWSAFEGFELAGLPELVVRRGEIVWSAGEARVAAGGRPLELEPPRPSSVG
ncbi:MAG: dihydroorotase family protein [Planctomycetes bacterium]|nr:dihydroorotase family protein [Planctomycetota bacterium]